MLPYEFGFIMILLRVAYMSHSRPQYRNVNKYSEAWIRGTFAHTFLAQCNHRGAGKDTWVGDTYPSYLLPSLTASPKNLCRSQ